MKQKIWDYMEKHHMLKPGDYVLCGCSGGADSVSLLLLLQEFGEKTEISLEAVCVEHGIRGEESRRDAAFVEKLCRERNILCSVRSVDVPEYAKKCHLGLEEAARILRYEAFWSRAEELMQQGHKSVCLALAHHMEDNAETMLFQMARGSGLAGLCGMPPVRMEGKVAVIRPLLAVDRGEIESYLADQKQQYCTDSTNADESFSRNRIRKKILPELSRINHKAVAHMNSTAEQLKDIRDYMEDQIRLKERELLNRQGEAWCLEIAKLRKLPRAIRDGVVRNAVFCVAGYRKDIAAVHVRDIIELLDKQSGRKISLPYEVEAWTEYGRLYFAKKASKETERSVYLEVSGDMLEKWKETGGRYEVALAKDKGTLSCEVVKWLGNPEEIVKKTYTKFFDYDKIKDGFLVRGRTSGDYFVMDRQGRHKKLSNYLIDEKIPASRRDEVLLLTQGSAVAWIVGGRIGENYKITEETVYILAVEYNGGNENGLHSKA